jgi:hypothetical protein
MQSNSFRVDRGLSEYAKELFEGEPATTLKKLGPDAVWLDSGAGRAVAIREFLDNLSMPRIKKVIGISHTRPEDPALAGALKTHSERFEYWASGKFIEEMDAQGELAHLKGQVDLITDVFGPASYSKDLSKILEIYLSLLKKGGSLVFNIPRYTTTRFPLVFTTISVGGTEAHQTEKAILLWLRKASGIRVEQSGPAGFNDYSFALKITRIDETVRVPPLELMEYHNHWSPPHRKYRLKVR